MRLKFTLRQVLLMVGVVAVCICVAMFVRSARGRVYRYTGIVLPQSAVIVHQENTYDAWVDHIGLVRVIAEADSEYCQKLISKPPPWSGAWQSGRVGSGAYLSELLPSTLWNDRRLNGSTVMYDVKTSDSDSRHSVIAIDTHKGVIFFYVE